MPPASVTITHREEFAAAHRLFSPELSEVENRVLYGPCYTLHGHNYGVEVTLSGPIDPRTGMVFDLNRLMQLMRREIVDRVDHKYLNEDVPFLAGLIPTAENLAIAFWERLRAALGPGEAHLECVSVIESAVNRAAFRGPTA